MQIPNDRHYDVIVCGGGMVGATLVSALLPAAKTQGLRIALIEQNPLASEPDPSYQPSFDARSTALAQGGRAVLESIGVWNKLQEHVTPIQTIHVSDKGRWGQTRMSAAEEKVQALGYVVENHWLGQVMMNTVNLQDKIVTVFSPAIVNSIEIVNNERHVSLKSADQPDLTLTAPLVVMADGGRSELREDMGIDYREKHYQQHALVANVEIDRTHKGVAYERFTEQGPIALLPLESVDSRYRMGLVWTLSDDQINEYMQLSDADFVHALQVQFGYRSGRFLSVGDRFTYPLKQILADEQVRPGLVVLGNAAHSLHPIAGQGFNLALRGVSELAQTIISAKREGSPLGDLGMLTGFIEHRKRDQQRTITFGDSALTVFSSSHPAMRLGRTLALQSLNSFPSARTLLARAAMGLDTPAVRLNDHD